MNDICKLYGFAKTEGLLDSISIGQCNFFVREKDEEQEAAEDWREPAAEAKPARPGPRADRRAREPAPERRFDRARLPVERDYTSLILASGSLEGIVSAAAVVFENNLESYRIYFTQPSRLEEAASQLHAKLERVFVCDIGVNPRATKATEKFIEKLAAYDYGWFDHHGGWDEFLGQTLPEALAGDRFQCDESATSTVALVTNDALLNGVVEETEGQDNAMGELFGAALASGPSDHSTRYDIVNYLLQVMANGQDEANKSKEYYRLAAKAEKYKRLQPVHRSLVEEGETIGSVFVMRQSSGVWVNYDEVYDAAFKKAPNAIILVEREGGLECRECGAGFRRPSRYGDCPRCHADNYVAATNYNTLVATSTELHLPNIFKVTGRMAHRVTLYGDRLEEALKTLNELTEKASPAAEPPRPEATADAEGEAPAGEADELTAAEADPTAVQA